MSTDARACWLAKRGHSPEEYEDAFATNDVAGRYAVADGASESSFSGLWAKLLVDQFVQDADRDPLRWTERLPASQNQLHTEVSRRPLPWYAEAQLQQLRRFDFQHQTGGLGRRRRRHRPQPVDRHQLGPTVDTRAEHLEFISFRRARSANSSFPSTQAVATNNSRVATRRGSTARSANVFTKDFRPGVFSLSIHKGCLFTKALATDWKPAATKANVARPMPGANNCRSLGRFS